MSNEKLGQSVAAIALDVLSAFHIPGTSTLGLTVQRVLDRRRDEAINVIVEAISASQPIEFHESEADEFVQMLLRFNQAVQSGAARQNLRLLAQVIVGLKKKQLFSCDEFQRWARILEDLTRDEILLLGTAYLVALERPDDSGTI